jgi:hypothetical protein
LQATATSSSARKAASSPAGSVAGAFGTISPCGSYPAPVTSKERPSASSTARTVSSLQVSVPVLSLATSVQLPRLSTAGSRRTMAPRFAMRRAPMASATVSATGSPSGMAETASATPNMNISATPRPWTRTPTAPSTITAPSTVSAIALLKRSMRSTSGGVPRSVSVIVMARPPTTVAKPVATTSP